MQPAVKAVKYVKDHGFALLVFILIAVAVVVPRFNDYRFWGDNPWSDEVVYITAAENILAGDYTYNAQHPPLVKMFFAAFIALFQGFLEPYQAARVCSVVFGALTCGLIYLHVGGKRGMLAGVSLSALEVYGSYVGNALLDVPYGFFATLTLVLYIRYVESELKTKAYLLGSGLAFGLAVSSKYFGFILPAVIALALLSSRKISWKSIVDWVLWLNIGAVVVLAVFTQAGLSNLWTSLSYMLGRSQLGYQPWYYFVISFPLAASPFMLFYGFEGAKSCLQSRSFRGVTHFLAFAVFFGYMTVQPAKLWHYMSNVAPFFVLVLSSALPLETDFRGWVKAVACYLFLHVYYVGGRFYGNYYWSLFLSNDYRLAVLSYFVIVMATLYAVWRKIVFSGEVKI